MGFQEGLLCRAARGTLPVGCPNHCPMNVDFMPFTRSLLEDSIPRCRAQIKPLNPKPLNFPKLLNSQDPAKSLSRCRRCSVCSFRVGRWTSCSATSTPTDVTGSAGLGVSGVERAEASFLRRADSDDEGRETSRLRIANIDSQTRR